MRAAALLGGVELVDRSDAYLAEWCLGRLDEYNPDQPRDEMGRFGEGGGGGKLSKADPHAVGKSRAINEQTHREFRGTDKHTQDLYKRDGKWVPERAALHEDYLAEGRKGVPKGDGTVYMTGGGPAAGKSKGLLQNPKLKIPSHDQAVHADPDGAKEWIPEFAHERHSGDPSVATRVHEESAYMSQRAVKEGLQRGHNVVYDSSGDGGIDKLEAKVKQMRADGAKKIVAHYATVDIDEAIRRSDARAKVEGRFVPHAYLRTVHRAVTQTALGAIDRGIYDNLDLWDTTSAGEPRHVASYTKSGGLKVHDEEGWKAFKKRGD